MALLATATNPDCREMVRSQNLEYALGAGSTIHDKPIPHSENRFRAVGDEDVYAKKRFARCQVERYVHDESLTTHIFAYRDTL